MIQEKKKEITISTTLSTMKKSKFQERKKVRNHAIDQGKEEFLRENNKKQRYRLRKRKISFKKKK